jgi:hypothetical protein
MPFNISLLLKLCVFIKAYFQPHFALQHSPHFLQEMHFFVIVINFFFAKGLHAGRGLPTPALDLPRHVSHYLQTLGLSHLLPVLCVLMTMGDVGPRGQLCPQPA